MRSTTPRSSLVPYLPFTQVLHSSLKTPSYTTLHRILPNAINMQNLPPELIEMITDSCDFTDLKALRSTCKSFCPSSIQRLFEEFRMGFFVSELKRFLNVAQHPVLSKYVKRFILVNSIIPNLESREEWERPSIRGHGQRINWRFQKKTLTRLERPLLRHTTNFPDTHSRERISKSIYPST